MTTRLTPCQACGQHVFQGASSCPHCGARFGNAGAPLRLGRTALSLGLVLTASVACFPVAKYGDFDSGIDDTSSVDADGDGYFSHAAVDQDCDDSDAAIHPGAKETPDDTVDSNCDGQDNT